MFEIKLAASIEDINTCYKLRETVFIEEQNVPFDRERDKEDDFSLHFLVFDNNLPIGTARIYKDNSTAIIGRICILKEHRGKNAGLFLMKNLVDYCKKHDFKEIVLGAQEYALGFYGKLGFETYGEKYLDANIPHFKMKLKI